MSIWDTRRASRFLREETPASAVTRKASASRPKASALPRKPGRPKRVTRVVHLDLWDGSAEVMPKITVTGEGLKFDWTDEEFDRLIDVLGAKP